MDLGQEELEQLAARLGEALVRRGWMLASAESCTGGWAAQAITAVAGSSAWFDRGFVTYSNAAKQDMLGVRAETLARHGAVSEATVREMAAGGLARGQARAVFAISGIAGPAGGSPETPVGTVCFAWALAGRPLESEVRHFDGDRRAIRAQSVKAALQGLLDRLQ
ncbi:MAG: nicotinamide-nucleotide amidohydrolase family protein [Thiobacillaceae bacterium]|jgi:nicotinamide-nucleotide amidase|nr:nicotinamide-nucleotide amidohydrolase family protein [Thiobacillaceae bacterium]